MDGDTTYFSKRGFQQSFSGPASGLASQSFDIYRVAVLFMGLMGISAGERVRVCPAVCNMQLLYWAKDCIAGTYFASSTDVSTDLYYSSADRNASQRDG